MFQKTSLLMLISSCLLITACSQQDHESAVLDCQQPNIQQSIKEQIQHQIQQASKQNIPTNKQQLIDSDKIIAAASQLDIMINNPVPDTDSSKPGCTAQLNVVINDTLWNQIEKNAPIIYAQQSLNDLATQQLVGSPIQMDQHTFSQPLQYLPATIEHPNVTINSPGIIQLSHILSQLLLPYAVKSIVVIDDKTYHLSELRQLFTQNQIINTQTESTLEQDEGNKALAILNGEQPSHTINNDSSTNDQISITENDLNTARKLNQTTNRQMNQLWQSLDPTVKESLSSEQNSWQTSKKQTCTPSDRIPSLEAQYHQLQCDTNITMQRIHYLKGFSIQ